MRTTPRHPSDGGGNAPPSPRHGFQNGICGFFRFAPGDDEVGCEGCVKRTARNRGATAGGTVRRGANLRVAADGPWLHVMCDANRWNIHLIPIVNISETLRFPNENPSRHAPPSLEFLSSVPPGKGTLRRVVFTP